MVMYMELYKSSQKLYQSSQSHSYMRSPLASIQAWPPSSQCYATFGQKSALAVATLQVLWDGAEFCASFYTWLSIHITLSLWMFVFGCNYTNPLTYSADHLILCLTLSNKISQRLIECCHQIKKLFPSWLNKTRHSLLCLVNLLLWRWPISYIEV